MSSSYPDDVGRTHVALSLEQHIELPAAFGSSYLQSQHELSVFLFAGEPEAERIRRGESRRCSKAPRWSSPP